MVPRLASRFALSFIEVVGDLKNKFLGAALGGRADRKRETRTKSRKNAKATTVRWVGQRASHFGKTSAE